MSEPSNTSSGGLIFMKFFTFFGFPALLSLFVASILNKPISKKEWFCSAISTIIFSVCGGSMVIQYLNIQNWINSYMGSMAIGGIIFISGIPGWIIVKSIFMISKRKISDPEFIKSLIINGKAMATKEKSKDKNN